MIVICDCYTGSPYHVAVTNPKNVVVTDGWKKLVNTQNPLEMMVNQEKLLHIDVKRAGPGITNGVLRRMPLLFLR